MAQDIKLQISPGVSSSHNKLGLVKEGSIDTDSGYHGEVLCSRTGALPGGWLLEGLEGLIQKGFWLIGFAIKEGVVSAVPDTVEAAEEESSSPLIDQFQHLPNPVKKGGVASCGHTEVERR
ncbi:hypothetical protein PIB30_093525 [Stylosanthes scabra]|uniref:Uncharacterized protein n=1 Tax=Stylosanthes scabra TaxID=79078 RepID=A0ABU6RW35_9FABA|nr:hypothetical protein [Stylosanthes scabra]